MLLNTLGDFKCSETEDYRLSNIYEIQHSTKSIIMTVYCYHYAIN